MESLCKNLATISSECITSQGGLKNFKTILLIELIFFKTIMEAKQMSNTYS